ncbi:MAG TPA: hypothetical protein VIE36_13130 [Methylomirabilota bacterium]
MSVVDGAAGDHRALPAAVGAIAAAPHHSARADIPCERRRPPEIDRVAALGERRARRLDLLADRVSIRQADDVEVATVGARARRGVEISAVDQRAGGVILRLADQPGAPEAAAIDESQGVELLVPVTGASPQLRTDDEAVAGHGQRRFRGKRLDAPAPCEPAVGKPKREHVVGLLADRGRVDVLAGGGDGQARAERPLTPRPVDLPLPAWSQRSRVEAEDRPRLRREVVPAEDERIARDQRAGAELAAGNVAEIRGQRGASPPPAGGRFVHGQAGADRDHLVVADHELAHLPTPDAPGKGVVGHLTAGQRHRRGQQSEAHDAAAIRSRPSARSHVGRGQ